MSKSRRHPSASLGAGELSSNHLPKTLRYPKETVRSEIDTVSDFIASGQRVVVNGNPPRRKKRR